MNGPFRVRGQVMEREPLYKVEEVARRLNVSAATVYRMVQAGRIEHHRIGCGRGAIRMSEAQVRSYLDGAERGLPATPAPRVKLRHLRLLIHVPGDFVCSWGGA